MHPILFPLWLAGLIWLLWEKRWRLLGLTFLVFFVTKEGAPAQSYYLFPIYPIPLAGGAVALERWLEGRARWPKTALVAVILLATVPTLPLATWLLSPERYLAYEEAIGFKPPKAEVHHDGLLPQPMGDQFGWPEMARQVADIYHSLPPEERAQTGIITGNYGEAGAIDQFGPAYGLPRAISGHQNHWYWGPPQERYRNFIVLQWGREDVQDNCAAFEAFEHYERFGMAEENTPIYLCRGAQFDLQRAWPRLKHWN